MSLVNPKITSLSIIVLALITSFAGMSYEIVIAQTLALLTDEVVLWESLSIGFFIAATGLGVFLFDSIQKKDIFSFFMQAEALLALVGVLAIPFLLLVHIYYRIYIADYIVHPPLLKPLNWVMLSCQTPNILIGLLAGLELRALFELFASHEEKEKTHSQVLVLVVYHLGALLASLLFAGLVYTKTDPYYQTLFASILNASVLLYCLFIKSPQSKQRTFGFTCLLLSLSMFYFHSQKLWETLRDLQIKNFYYNTIRVSSDEGEMKQMGPVHLYSLPYWAAKLPDIKRRLSNYQVIDYVPTPDKTDEWKLFLDGHFQFSSKTEPFYHETLAHIPIMLSDTIPEQVLVLGGGDGLLSRELLKYKEKIRHIDLVELDREMIQLGKSLPFSSLNANSLFDPRVHIHIADAFAWLRLNQTQFDALYIDFPYPYTFEGLRVYSVEFFALAARHLSENGFVIMDIPIFNAGDSSWEEHVSSLLKKAGFANVLAFEGNYSETFVLALKKNTPLPFAFRDKGVPLTVLDPTWFAEREMLDLTERPLTQVNSVLKPKRISLPDVWK
jgi:spermidine synthase